MQTIREVMVVFKTHLDIGYTDMARHVRERYLHSYIPKALRLAEELRKEAGKPVFVWTTGSWLIDEYLREADARGQAAMERAIASGDISWHGLPFTTHTELMDEELARYGIGLAQSLDRRYGRRTIAAKLTDVPGHTRGLVPLLAEAGISFLHIGVNPVSVPPDVPPLFRWRAPGGKEIAVMYQFGYGGYAEIPGTGKALVFAHTGDNNGPQSAGAVRELYSRLKTEFPGALVRPADLNDIALAVEEIRDTLPVVTQEIGDSWIHGAGSDPQKMSQYRALLRLRKSWTGRARETANRWLIQIPEHTWGLDYKTYLKDYEHFAREEFEAVRSQPAYQKMERSWEEQRGYLTSLTAELSEKERLQAQRAMEEYKREPVDVSLYRRVPDPAQVQRKNGWEIGFDESGAVSQLAVGRKKLADPRHRLGVFRYEIFSRRETDRFCSQYVDCSRFPELAPLAVDDFNKLGAEKAVSAYRSCGARLSALYETEEGYLALLTADEELAETYGCPKRMALEVRMAEKELQLDFIWWEKAATRVPEGLWLGMNPLASGARIQKLGRPVDPLDVVRFGGRALHGTDWGVQYEGMSVETLDTALVGIGEPSLWNFTGEQPDPAGGIWFNLCNNMWNTNFPLWYGQDSRFRFILRIENYVKHTK